VRGLIGEKANGLGNRGIFFSGKIGILVFSPQLLITISLLCFVRITFTSTVGVKELRLFPLF